MDRTCAEFWNVDIIPDPAPRSSAGRLFMTAARLANMKRPLLNPISRSSG